MIRTSRCRTRRTPATQAFGMSGRGTSQRYISRGLRGPSARAGRGRFAARAASRGGDGEEWKQKYERAVNEDLPKFWKEFRKQATLR